MRQFLLMFTAVLMAAASIAAQTTAFTFQGRLNTSGSPASGTYEIQFQVFDSAKGGTQVGTTITDPSVAVANGIFTTTLDFGAAAFDGSARFVEIGVRPAGNTDPFTILVPRQTIKSTPYSIQSKNAVTADGLSANCISCVTSSQIQTVDGAQITGVLPTVTIPTGSDNYIQNAAVARGNGKDGAQPMASLNIGGNATVGSLDVNGPASFAAVGAPALAPAGQGRIYFDSGTNKVKVSENGGAFVNLVGATGVSGSGTVNTIPLFSAGTTLGNSLISQSGGTILLPTFLVLADTPAGNHIALGTPNSGTGMTISGPTARADVRLDGTTLRLAAGAGGVGPPGNGIGIDATTVTLPASVILAATASGNNITFGSPNSGTGMTIAGPTNRADLRLDGSILRLAAGPAGNIPQNGIAINTAGNVGIGTTNPIAALHVVGTTRTSVVEITGGSDLAEKFSFSEPVKPGMVVAIDAKNSGRLKLARGVYNRQVAGVISGANNLSAGLTLPDLKDAGNAQPVALSGRVWVYCDAGRLAIRPGDMLTTSATPGHAMRVLNHSRAQGAILGKAMTELKTGRGLVLVLVTLQ